MFNMDDSFAGFFDEEGYHKCTSSIADSQSRTYCWELGAPLPQSTAYGKSRPMAAMASHDDLCVDQCEYIGVSNGFQQLPNHRARQGPLTGRAMSYSALISPTFAPGNQNRGYGQEYYAGFHNLYPQYHQAQGACQQGYAGCDYDTRSNRDSCCDSQCTMANKCTDDACADQPDACTDQTCPGLPQTMPSEVFSGAAALMHITQGPEQHSQGLHAHNLAMGTDIFNFNFPHDPSPAPITPSANQWSLNSLTGHIISAHSSGLQSTLCTTPCPLTDYNTYNHCPFPTMDLPLDIDPTMLSRNSKDGSDVCGAHTFDPANFLAHVTTQHKHYLSTVPLPTLPENELFLTTPSPASFDSSNPGTGGDVATSRASNSTGRDTPDTRPSSASPEECLARSRQASSATTSDLITIEPGSKPECLWCDDDGLTRCGKVFETAEELFNHSVKEHIQDATKGDGGYQCGWQTCRRGDADAPGAQSRGFPQKSKIIRHIQTHIGFKPFTCEICQKTFSAKQALMQHKLIHSDEKPLRCSQCKKEFRHQSALTMHLRTHTGLKPLECPVCQKLFSESSNLSKHKRTHDPKGRFMCGAPGCERTFHRQDQLRRHMRVHEKSNTQP